MRGDERRGEKRRGEEGRGRRGDERRRDETGREGKGREEKRREENFILMYTRYFHQLINHEPPSQETNRSQGMHTPPEVP